MSATFPRFNYVIRRGTGDGRPAASFHELVTRFEEAPDDGAAATLPVGRVEVPCLDCGGALTPAEAGFDRGHRVCSRCGSHWQLRPRGARLELARARFYAWRPNGRRG